jgi:hypothetical protein
MLAVLGAALLVFMHAFDVGLAAYEKPREEAAATEKKDEKPAVTEKKEEQPTLADKEKDVLAAVFNREAWLKPSWFLLIPLALNAFVLCPIIAFKALRARRNGFRAGGTTGSLAVAAALALVTLIYFKLLEL